MENIDLLNKLLSFYSARYTGKILEEKFNDAVYELVKSDDIKISDYIKFCIDNNIEPTVKEKGKTNDFDDPDISGIFDDWSDITPNIHGAERRLERQRQRNSELLLDDLFFTRQEERGLGCDSWEF